MICPLNALEHAFFSNDIEALVEWSYLLGFSCYVFPNTALSRPTGFMLCVNATRGPTDFLFKCLFDTYLAFGRALPHSRLY